jgi:hypothetical protein
MPPYKSPEFDSKFIAKFVRVDNTIIVGEPNDFEVKHKPLAEREGIFTQIQRRVREDLAAADAGFYTVDHGEIVISSSSSSLALPLAAEARDKSVTVFQNLSPGFKVRS